MAKQGLSFQKTDIIIENTNSETISGELFIATVTTVAPANITSQYGIFSSKSIENTYSNKKPPIVKTLQQIRLSTRSNSKTQVPIGVSSK
ncbi:hypothetical protein [Leuconostoc mesenteroides]|jgi:hypothetical protein|uniref:hypothetical protein n=4 Tax=Lactobacillaceae TaxID=33958 RepID=UPI000E08FE6E|nr:hypothetical protein [Leuconostoc mesenteroides]RDF88764.1 hypothetical protein DQM09_09975 [Leuconostoc mesenteroides subsp. mesenteroides]